MIGSSMLMQADSFLPHGYCYLWRPGLLWLHLISDSTITLSYYSIPVALVYLVRKRNDVPFGWMFWLFAIFIAGCGTTHLMEIWTLWHPTYWLAGGVKAVTALSSIATAITLIPLIPKALAIPSPAALRDANEALRQEVIDRRRAEENLARSNSFLESFSYSVAHDLRAPLRAIDGYSHLLVEEEGKGLSSQGRQLLDSVRGNTVRMAQMIDGLLEFSRLGRVEPNAADLDLTPLAGSVVDEARRAEPGREVEVIIEPLPLVRADRILLRHVMTNLVSNAFKFTRGQSHPRIEIGVASSNGDEPVVYVRDNGAGFDPRYTEKLFGVFQRLHRADEFEGTGVGLALVRQIIRRHGGRVWAESQLGEGATFYFSLPVAGGAAN